VGTYVYALEPSVAVIEVGDTGVVEGSPEEAPTGSAVLVLNPEDVLIESAVLVVDSLLDVEEALRGAAVLVEKVVGCGGEEKGEEVLDVLGVLDVLDVLAAVVGREGVGTGLEVSDSEAVGSKV
jgi:hypothetical protein